MRLIGLAGQKQSGKSTIAGMIAVEKRATCLAFADPMKEFVSLLFGWSREDLEDGAFKERCDERYPRREADGHHTFLTPRFALQSLGTEWGRSCYPNVWVGYAIRRAKILDGGTNTWVLITDVRFCNESKAIRDAGGEVWRIHRPHAGGGSEKDLHPSERGIFSPEMDKYVTREILNSGSLADLKFAIMSLINQ